MGEIFFIGQWESEEEPFRIFGSFSKLKATCCQYWTSFEIETSMTCVQRVWSENKNGSGAITKSKNEFFIGV